MSYKLKRFESPDCPTLDAAFTWVKEQIQNSDLQSLSIMRMPGKWPNVDEARPYVAVAVVKS